MPIATVNFSVPEEVKQASRQRRRAAAIEALLELRQKQRPVTDAEVVAARHEGRPQALETWGESAG